MIKPGGGDRTSCKKPHPEQATPRLTVNKYSLLAALPSTVRALAPIAFQVQTGKGRKESEMADRRFNLLLAPASIGGALPIQQDCQLPGIAPGPLSFLLTFIIVLLPASPQLASQGRREHSSSLHQISKQSHTGWWKLKRQWTHTQGALRRALLKFNPGSGAAGQWVQEGNTCVLSIFWKMNVKAIFAKCTVCLEGERCAKENSSSQ